MRSTRSGWPCASRRTAALPDRRRVLPMELQIGDRLSAETGEWEVIGRPYSGRPTCMKRLKCLAHALGGAGDGAAGMTAPEPSYPPLSTREIGTLPEGARVIVTWSEGNDGPHEYRVHWSRGELYAQTDEEHYAGRVDLEKWLTYTSGRGARSRESGLSPLRVPNDGGIERPARVRNAPGAWDQESRVPVGIDSEEAKR